MGPDGNADYDAYGPQAAYNSTNNEYLVVWYGDDNTSPLVNDENEIYGQRIWGNHTSGDEVGDNDFRISDMGDDSEATPTVRDDYDAGSPGVAYNSTDNEYLVVWYGDDDTLPLVDDETEIFGQRINAATGDQVGNNDFRISDMGDDSEPTATEREKYSAASPKAAYNSTNNEYLVVWTGDDDISSLVDGESEVFGQRIYGDRAAGDTLGRNDFRLSDMGPDGDTGYGMRSLGVAYASTANEYLAVWASDDDTSPLVDGEFEIFGQRWELPAEPNLSIVKAVDLPIAGPGQTITYTLNIANLGTVTATNVLITDSVPVSVTHNSLQFASSLSITATGSISYVWQVQNLAPGQSGSITITGQISASLLQNHVSFTNTARITTTAAITDSDPYNNSSAAAVTVTHFSEAVDAPLLGIQAGSAAWGDYDNDGDLDIFSTGQESGGDPYVTKIYRNDGSDVFVTAVGTMSGTQFYKNAEPWGDYDNDGDLDILIAGNGDTNTVARIYRNDGSDTFSPAITETTLMDLERGATAWGDYDNDGDLDIFTTGENTKLYAMIYRNDGADGFTEAVTDPLDGVAYSAAAWGDYDNDGDLDLFLTGHDGVALTAVIYRNDGADNFTMAITSPFIGVQHGSAAWGDYDNDGDLDILVTGWNTAEGYTALLYRNDGAGTFVKAVSDPLAGVQDSSIDWGDYDNDGDLDILLTGSDSTVTPVTKIYRNDGSDTFVEVNADPLENIDKGAAVWGDYDNDGDLDIFLTGHTGGSNVVAKIYRNNTGVYNTVPDAPGDLSAQVSGTEVELGWVTPPAGSTTPGKGLTYNLYVGASPSKVDIVSPHAFTTTRPLTNGLRLLPAMGYAQHGIAATLSLTEGLYSWSVQAIDHTFSGSPFATEEQFIIDVHVPDAPVLSSPTDTALISDTTPTLDWNAATDNGPAGVVGYNVQISTTNVYTVMAPITQYTPTTLADGTYTWTVRAYDAVGNYGPYTDTWSFTVDTTPPNAPTLVSPADSTVTNTTELTLTWGAVAGAAGYMLDFDSSVIDVGNTTISTTGVLVDGTYTWTVASYDAISNTSTYTDTWSFTVDTTPPDTSITAQPPNPDNDTTPTFEFTGDDFGGSGVASFECQLDGGSWATCNSPHITAILTDSLHTFEVRAIDNLGYTDTIPASYTWTVDTSLLDAPVLISPENGTFTATTSPTITWGTVTGAAGYLVDFDGTVVDVGNVTFSATGVLADGTYTWTVVAYDVLSNTGAYTDVWSFTVDTTPPDTTITVQPSNPDNNPIPSFEFTGDDLTGSGVASFECQLDGGGWSTCTSPHTTASLNDGPHTFEVRAIDNLGHTDVSPASYTWTVDATAPSITNVNPTNGAADVPRNALVTVDFDESMDTITVSYSINPAITLTPTWNIDENHLTLTHDELAANTSYSVTIDAGSDSAGNPLSNAPYIWVFSTGDVSLPEADLALGKARVGAGDVTAGERITYTLTVTNAGPTTPVTVTIVDSFAPTDTLAGVSGEGCVWPGAEVVTCTVTNVTTVTPHVLTLVVTTSNTYSGTLSNSAIVAPVGQVIDLNSGNDDAGPVLVTVISTSTGDQYIYLPLVLRND
ncbi:MAG: DUF11 domain-containing protein, partial [Chloroflexi bacterium]|nr:DUF11 domain-containing protein [Chloroflexota bacterium]